MSGGGGYTRTCARARSHTLAKSLNGEAEEREAVRETEGKRLAAVSLCITGEFCRMRRQRMRAHHRHPASWGHSCRKTHMRTHVCVCAERRTTPAKQLIHIEQPPMET